MSTGNVFTAIIVMLALVLGSNQSVNAQRRGIQIGGPNGLVIGGGYGFRAGGPNGVQFGGGEGARFGPRGAGVQFGGGVGARFGPGLQIGGRYTYRYPTYPAYRNYYSGVAPANVPDPAVRNSGHAGYANAAPSMSAPTPVRSPDTSVVSTAPEMIVIQYPESAKQSLRYTINGTPFQLAPGNKIQMQPGLDWEIGLPGKGSKKNAFKLVEPGTYPLKQTENGWKVDAEPVSRSADEPVLAPTPAEENSILAPTPSVEPQEEAVEPPANSDVEPTVFIEEVKEQPQAPKMKSILKLNDK